MKILINLLFLSLITTKTASLPPTIGVTYNPTITPSPSQAAATLQTLNITAVRLPNPDPPAIQAFSNSNISLLLSIPNSAVSAFAANRSAAVLWLRTHVLPFYPTTNFTAISAGEDFINSGNSSNLLPAMRNVHASLLELGIRDIAVSTTFSFETIVTTPFPPSDAELSHSDLIIPILDFLIETNSSFMVNIYPFRVYDWNGEVPVDYALFQGGPLNFHDDLMTGARYRNLFDSMVDAVSWAIETAGRGDIPIIVTETGWPNFKEQWEADESKDFAGMYVDGLIRHLESGEGTPMRGVGAVQTYIYELFDTDDRAWEQWGILYRNMTQKYHIHF